LLSEAGVAFKQKYFACKSGRLKAERDFKRDCFFHVTAIRSDKGNMVEKRCPVNECVLNVSRVLESGELKIPRNRRMAEEILQLMRDIATGAAGAEHVGAVNALSSELLATEDEKAAAELGRYVDTVFANEIEAIKSHVKTHICPTGECERLTPAPCQMACPAGIDIPTYVSLIGLGRDAEAIEIIRKDNPFPWVCGLVCTRPCEFMCVRGRIDTPVSIKFLKAFAAERALSERTYKNPEKEPAKNKKVCIIGAGPGGLSAAYYLALKGYSVRVIEALPTPGGMIMVGIPRYRLPREVIDREVAMIEDLGVEFRYSTYFGSDVTLEQLKNEGFEAFLFAIGAHKAYKMRIPGEDDFPQVVDAIDLLKKVALGDRHIPGKKVIVIGGGNVAVDAARTCLRLGCDEVTIAYRRTRTEMPADGEEVEQAEEEGIRLSFLTVPVAIKGEDGQVEALQCQKAKMVAQDGRDRMSPIPVEGSDFFMAADVIIAAIGQQVDRAGFEDLNALAWTRRQTIDVNMANMETSMEGVFAVGDAVTGPATVIGAIGGGKRAANSIDRYLAGIPQPEMPPVPVRRGRVDYIDVPASTKMILKKPEMPLLNIDRRRTTYQQVELGYPENAVREEARRCLRCDICRRCGLCVEVCRDKMKIDALHLGYLDFDHPVETDFRLTEEACIACGACAENCPNDAMRIEEKNGERLLSLCGTILNRQKLVYCRECGATIGPLKYLEYIRQRVATNAPVKGGSHICETCARAGKRGNALPVSNL
jgi:NADPH-dependent glutamate synthase beta subunit-like oxidoreductase